ncbi:MAG: reverse transcriptase domain-containing protein [Culicoidibacterales bacterium]
MGNVRKEIRKQSETHRKAQTLMHHVNKENLMTLHNRQKPNRNCHQAIKKIKETIMNRKINYVLDADIKDFFDNVDHKWLVKFLEHDIEDKNFIRYIVLFLKSEIMEEITVVESDKGTPQGGRISPTYTVYLHYVLDIWFEKPRRKAIQKDAELVRHVDNFVIMFEYEEDAKKWYKQLKERVSTFNLELAEDKTRNVWTKETFNCLGFRHINGKRLKGRYRLHPRNSISKMKQKKQTAKQWIRKQQHQPIGWMMKSLQGKLIGHYVYYGISGNYTSRQNFNLYIKETCYKTLNKRDQKKSMS